jgi:hypothetical protein
LRDITGVLKGETFRFQFIQQLFPAGQPVDIVVLGAAHPDAFHIEAEYRDQVGPLRGRLDAGDQVIQNQRLHGRTGIVCQHHMRLGNIAGGAANARLHISQPDLVRRHAQQA